MKGADQAKLATLLAKNKQWLGFVEKRKNMMRL
jgi:hypothetical protein